ncbi:MAG: ATP-dependent Clp protease ATP-binding subunit [Clostridia bacterium]|nr:ATP-dependent Clp protease ATP-binding subunit [Clostridia bacterium]
MWGALIATVVLSAVLNTIGFIAAKPIYDIISETSFFNAERNFVMSEYCEDMVEKARSGEYHDFFMRDDKIEKLTDILSLGSKSNPCIVGSRGVGKSALVEGLAYRIAYGKAPEKMNNKKIFKLDVSKMIAWGGNSRSNALSRLKAILNKAKSDKNIILFIEDICRVYEIDGASELIKTYLDNSDIKIIASSTDEEYSDILKNDSFAQDYTYIFMEEPGKFDTFRILKYLKSDVEKKQNIKVFDEVLMDIVNLTGRYMKNKCYPNKAVDILNLAPINAQKRSNEDVCELERRDVIEAISEVTNMPIGDLSEDEAEVLETMNERIKKLVVGQDGAVDIVCFGVKRARLGLCDENKPRASFLFVGPPGVGKSELARVLGEEVGSFINIDMLSFRTQDSVKGLRGSRENKSELVEKIKKNPYSVVMFDNADSASDEALNVVYEILDRGYLKDFSGKKVDFTNSIIILTADLGDGVLSPKQNQEILKKSISDRLKKGILKKLTDIVIFNNLSQENYDSIVRMKLSKLESRLGGFGIGVKISDDVLTYIYKLCVCGENQHGARVVDKVICEKMEIPISDLMMKRVLKSGGQVYCVLEGGTIKFEIQKTI